MKYIVQVSETLIRRVVVEAENAELARQKAEDDYHDCKLVLSADDYVDGSVQIEVLGTEEDVAK